MTTAIELTEAEARQLTDRIKVAVEGTWLLIQEAYTSRAWAALGYRTWDEYCTAEFGAARLRLPREERQEVVASLRESGLSTRAIAVAVGQSDMQVRRDLAATKVAPGEITGVDGKPYAATRPTARTTADLLAGDDWVSPGRANQVNAEPQLAAEQAAPIEPPKPKRRPLPEAFSDAVIDFTRAADRLDRLTQDDRFTRNRDQTHQQMPELLGALGHATALIQAMSLDQAAASEEARRWWAASLNTISDSLKSVARTIEQDNR